ncbi:hypothetical protein LOK49_LG04G00649 [Camellia lanceoleosa]|uniref:Uncharacterized protein n=1 Tax=Camellia lanceoleosa TaxID=1840588 RepID=A0ACC0I1U6_9ERIC|nr:hypothetical protein LOK49_LG04G00649 [Camellia lanceoleosa]
MPASCVVAASMCVDVFCCFALPSYAPNRATSLSSSQAPGTGPMTSITLHGLELHGLEEREETNMCVVYLSISVYVLFNQTADQTGLVLGGGRSVISWQWWSRGREEEVGPLGVCVV